MYEIRTHKEHGIELFKIVEVSSYGERDIITGLGKGYKAEEVAELLNKQPAVIVWSPRFTLVDESMFFSELKFLEYEIKHIFSAGDTPYFIFEQKEVED